MAAVLEDHQTGLERGGGGLRRLDGNGILSAMRDQGGHVDGIQHPRLGEIEVPETVPDRLLNPGNDTKRREPPGAVGISEVAGDAELERPLPVGLRIALAKT